MKWNTGEGECQLFLDVDCSSITYETQPSAAILAAVDRANTAMSTLGKQQLFQPKRFLVNFQFQMYLLALWVRMKVKRNKYKKCKNILANFLMGAKSLMDKTLKAKSNAQSFYSPFQPFRVK